MVTWAAEAEKWLHGGLWRRIGYKGGCSGEMVTWAAVAEKWLLEGCGGEVVTGGLLRRNGYRRAVAEKWSQENCRGEMVTWGAVAKK